MRFALPNLHSEPASPPAAKLPSQSTSTKRGKDAALVPTTNLPMQANTWVPGHANHTFAHQISCVCGTQRCEQVTALRSPRGFGYALRSCRAEQMEEVQDAVRVLCAANLVVAGDAGGDVAADLAGSWPVVGFVANMDVAAQNLAASRQDAPFYACLQNTLQRDLSYGPSEPAHAFAALGTAALWAVTVTFCAVSVNTLLQMCLRRGARPAPALTNRARRG